MKKELLPAVNVRLPQSVYDKLHAISSKNCRSMAEQVRYILQGWLAGDIRELSRYDQIMMDHLKKGGSIRRVNTDPPGRKKK